MKFKYPQLYTAENKLSSSTYYTSALEHIFENLLPPFFLEHEGAYEKLQELLPLVKCSRLAKPPFALSFFLCTHFRPNAFRFFHEMVTRWLIPGRRINAFLQFAVDFTLPESGDQKYIGGEIVLQIETEKELTILEQNLPIIESEIRLGVVSEHQANRILEFKGLNADNKTALIQESIASLIKRRPQDFDYGIFKEMQHFLVSVKEGFKVSRSYKHMSRILCSHYLFRKALKLSNEAFPERRYVSAKLIRTKIEQDKQQKGVLGIVIGISYLRSHEVFEEHHFLNALRTILPDVKLVSGSFFSQSLNGDPIWTGYLEVEKEDESLFSHDEINLVKLTLPGEVKNHIEQRHQY